MLQQLRTTDPALAYHVHTYLDAYQKQQQPEILLQRWIELDIVREAALIHIALTKGYIERTPDQVFLPQKVWAMCIDLITELTQQ